MGKKHLEAAIAHAKVDASVEWAPFFLRHGIPEEGVPKPGGPGLHQVNVRLREAGAKCGINFTGMTDRFPNTMKAHCLLTFALEKGGPPLQNKLQEVLFRHYFTDGRYPDTTNLVAASEEVGLSATEVQQVLGDNRYEARVQKEAENASRSINGVPYFYVNGRPLFSGAHPPEAFLEAFQNL